MKISVITPSFNQAQFLPANLSSVRSQTYRDVEQIIVDPGSKDDSRDIAAAAEHALLIAEPDRGQSDGITKGFSRSSGDILTWLNSDDFYPSERVLEIVAREFEQNPDIDVVYGNVNFVDEQGAFLRKGYINQKPETLLESFQYQVGIVQPGLFMRRSVFEAVGGPSEQYEYCMDYEYWVRISTGGFKWKHVDEILAHHRWWGGMKTSKGRDASLVEHMRVCNDYFGYIHWKWLDRYAEYLTSNKDGVVNHSSTTDPEVKARNLKSVIARFVSQDMMSQIEASKNEQQRDTLEFIRTHAPDMPRYYFPAEEIASLSETHPAPDATKRTAWHIFDGIDAGQRRYKTYNVPGNFHRAFDAQWYDETLKAGAAKLQKLAQHKKSNICVVVANGPSLNKTDLSLLTDVDVIISNFATLNETLLKSATMVTVTNTLVAEQGGVAFNNIQTPKILPVWLSHRLNHTEETSFVSATVCPDFCTSLEGEFSWRSTVSYFNMQLAFALGFEKVLLVGFDHFYTQPENVKEGDRIEQKDDDENHFDPRYFKNKVWQAADTGNMEAMYKLAKSAFERAGREIVNCTVGGHLEVFRRGDLTQELSNRTRAKAPPKKAAASERHPRTLVFDMTVRGNGTATGELKENIFGNWPQENYLQVFLQDRETLGICANGIKSILPKDHAGQIKDVISSFNPEVILYRPVPDTELLHTTAMSAIRARPHTPLVTWIMDDWPTRLERDDRPQFTRLDPDWKWLLQTSALRLSIGKKMSSVLEGRYGLKFEPFANGVDPAQWDNDAEIEKARPFVIRYAGALADNMTADSVLRVAKAVEELAADGVPVRMEIRTRPLWKDQQAHLYAQLKHTEFCTELLSSEDYRKWISGAGGVLLAYNFDADSLAYTRLSMANKLPECLASGAPLIAHGPSDAATISYLQENECALVVDEPDVNKLKAGIRGLICDTSSAKRLADKARVIAFSKHNLGDIRNRFRDAIVNASRYEVLGPQPGLERSKNAHVDETAVVALMLSERTGRQHVMLDVGAHFGTSAQYFDELGWSIHCFEPDPNNRKKLQSRFGNSPNVRIDDRAVSDQPATGLKFFTSGESTGISGLHAFHDTHKVTATVDATTVSEIARDRAISRVDFLKIDVEGFDLNVLKGVPWETLQPDVIECEFEDAKTLRLGHDWKHIADYLEARGYTVYVSEWHPIVRYGTPHDWRRVVPYRRCELDSDAWGNFLAFKEDPGYKAVISAFAALVKYRPQLSLAAVSTNNQQQSLKTGAPAKTPPIASKSISTLSPNKAAPAQIPLKQTDDQNGNLSMLQKTPSHALQAPPPPGPMWYAAPAQKLQQVSPPLFGALRFARRSFVHMVSRPHLIGLLLGATALAAWVGFSAQFDDSRNWILASAGIGLLGAAIIYVAAKAQAHIAALHIQNVAVHAELSGLQERLKQVDQQIILRDNPALASLNKQIAELQSALALAKASSSQITSDLGAKTANLSVQLSELSEAAASLPGVQADIAKLGTAIKLTQDNNDQNITAAKDAIAKVSADVAPLSQKLAMLDNANQALTAKLESLSKQIEAIQATDTALRGQVDALKSDGAKVGGAISTVSDKVGAIDARITASEKWSRFDNAAWFQHFNRKLSKQHIETLDKEWRKRLSIPMQPATLGYMANRACEIERQLEGRLATSIEDILLRSLVARAVRGKNVDVLEIGTLFGTGAAIMFDALDGHYDEIHFTLLDPLEGYYNGAQADILTGQRVNEQVVRKNFSRVGMSEDQYTLIKHLSTEPDAMQKAATRKYDVLVIDGDHSYAGVKTDFENYAPLVRVGGYIILDDYNSPDWPDVKEYVDNELGKHDFIAPVGATWRTSVYRVVKDTVKAGRTQSPATRKKPSVRPDAEDTQISDE
ncbi:MAG: hypothetical protein CVT79_10460 [Alphaproteobacteria bacterium HGW-Alphaproteobacteria-18]|nr:MAG: hypothetical protein CVT79_10460 [Alphaproteobacteria bacterium HGW-Alphaproteobacteria-18]